MGGDSTGARATLAGREWPAVSRQSPDRRTLIA
jgi:hypothetical protein